MVVEEVCEKPDPNEDADADAVEIVEGVVGLDMMSSVIDITRVQ